jgi:hypothetical protein
MMFSVVALPMGIAVAMTEIVVLSPSVWGRRKMKLTNLLAVADVHTIQKCAILI